MKILVCVKQVHDTESPLEIDGDRRWVRDDGPIAFRMNRYDEFALEEAVLIREALGDVTVDALSVGPLRFSSTLKKSLEKGAANGIHILYENGGYCPPSLTAALIAGYARDKSYDLILCGVMAEDDMQCQVGPLIAARLGLPCAVSVVKETIGPDKKRITAECELEGGINEIIELPMPCLLTIQSGINRPRYPSLSNVLRAKEQKLVTVPADPGLLTRRPEQPVSLSYPEKSSTGMVISGTPEQKAEQLLAILHEKSLL
ncbi:MAG TPA: electron transfer flavoprotein subunit beta/FixA family protein [Spirochaetota bacterium]|nr:electron transfer flavoprotein subunit beta/FixA family protein [Spirochaetota bacterium]HPC39404.1 electron transfer flavoprotein subunit beta/FixA family protein [Spirochaetota bacterium]HPL16891.1 electron transfer flavoprotein subunit beta/FixA family protein [Spirochaetota bacterium]HQF06741.1 electron transfer flavoprotein subunit beta/FixA family protein [Spirochaetota bacterium]HQH95640.1 electron transfer flavoprotein subunit beta/FixA family protein [Spirochaetota bacterium]